MSWEWDNRFVSLLPEHLAVQVRDEEPERFKRLVSALQRVAESIPDASYVRGHPQVYSEIAPWLTHVHRFVKARVLYDVEDIAALYRAMEHLVFATQPCIDHHAKWLVAAHELLDTFRYQLHGVLVLDYERYCGHLEGMLADESAYRLDATGTAMAISSATKLCKLAKNYFDPSSAATIWQRLHPQLAQPLSTRHLRAISQLLIFFPARAVASAAELPWNEWAQEAVNLWQQSAHNSFWGAAWMCFLSRLAKHDRFGRIQWTRLLQPICSRAMWFFEVPIGEHLDVTRTYATHPAYPWSLVSAACIATGGNSAGHLAKVLCYTLRDDSSDAASEGDTSSLQCTTTLCTLLEHYFHANTAGKWSPDIAHFLSGFAHSMVRRRLPGEAYAKWRGADHVRVSPATVGRLTDVLLPLCLSAMHHKSQHLKAAAAEVIKNFVYFRPQSVLRAVLARLMEALEATNATHQLTTAIYMLAGVVRPMLLYGLHPQASEGEGEVDMDAGPQEAQELACQELGNVMTALLPGIDANDNGKTQATITLYLSVLSNCVAFSGQDIPAEGTRPVVVLGFYAEEFVLGLLQRLFGVMQDLGTSGAAADGSFGADLDGASSRMTSSLYDGRLYPLLRELFAKMPQALVATAARKVHYFVLSIAEVQLAADAYFVLSSCTERLGGGAIDLFLKPLMEHFEANLHSLSDAANPPKAQAKRLMSQLTLIRGVQAGLGPLVAPHADALVRLALSASKVGDRGVMAFASGVTDQLARSFTMDDVGPLPDTGAPANGSDASLGVPESLHGAVARWYARDAAGALPLAWCVRTDEEVARGRALLESCLADARADLDAMVADGSIADPAHAARLRLHRNQMLLYIVSQVAGPTGAERRAAPDAAGLQGAADPAVDSIATAAAESRAWAGCTLRADALEATLAIVEHADAGNTDALYLACHYLEAETGVPRLAAARKRGHSLASPYDRFANESCVADLLLGRPTASAGLFDRQPYWLTRSALMAHCDTRAARAAATLWPSSAQPQLRVEQLAPGVVRAASALLRLSLHRYATVSGHAARALASYTSHVSSDFAALVFPAAVRAAALLDGGAADAATLPQSSSDAAEQVDAHLEPLQALVKPALRRTAAAPAGADAPEGAAQAGVCTSDNKHAVQGALRLLEWHRGSVMTLARASDAHGAALFLTAVLAQSYVLPEVRSSVQRFIAGFVAMASRPHWQETAGPRPARDAVSALFLQSLASSDSQWRGVVMAHLWMASLCPEPSACGEHATAVVQRLLRQVADENMLLVKDSAIAAFNQRFDVLARGGASAEMARPAAETCRAALAPGSALATGLVASLDSLHSLERAASLQQMVQQRTAASVEAMVPALLHKAVRPGSRRDKPILHHGQKLSGTAPAAGTGPPPRVLWNNVAFVEALARVVPCELLAAVKKPLLEWRDMPPQEEAREHSMEFTAMEICHAAVASRAAFCTPNGHGGDTPWAAWLKGLIEARWVACAIQKVDIWARVLAITLRVLATRAAGLETVCADLDEPSRLGLNAEQALATFVAFVCELTEGWSGDGSSDGKCSTLLGLSIDHVTQVQATAACPAVGDALARLVHRSQSLCSAGRQHPLSTVRSSLSNLVMAHLCVLRSPEPLLPGGVGDAEAAMRGLVDTIYTDAEAAVARANTAVSTHDGPVGVLPPEAAECDAPIDCAAALTVHVAYTGCAQHLLQDVVAQAVPWTVGAQALQCPGLKATTASLRSAARCLAGVMLHPGQAGRVVRVTVDCLGADAWQTRGSALSLLQCFWFRNYFALSLDELAAVLRGIRTRLSDGKLEMRALASSALSGLARVLPDSVAAELRAEILAAASELFPKRAKHSKGGGDAAGVVVRRHACALALRGLLNGSPHTIPAWMNDVLLATVRAARYPAPVGVTAVKALGEFRKTHESAESRSLKERLPEDTWEGIVDVAVQSSYFA